MEKLNLRQTLKPIFTLVCCAMTFLSIGQADTSDVFVIGDEKIVEQKEDTLLVKRRDITNCFKFDVARVYSGVYILSFEHLIDDDRWSLEYELGFDIETERFWYDWYTDKKFVEPENNSPLFSAGFRSSYDFVFGGGIALKHYISKRKSGIYGWYFGVKLKERYGHASVKNNSGFGTFPSLEYNGAMNFFEVSAIGGYSMCFWDFLIVDPFLGPSAILVSTRYASFEEDVNGVYWQEKRSQRILPAIHFGLRIGVSGNGVRGLFF